LVWIDEAHHVGARTFQDLIAHVAPPMLGGATATPWRGDRYEIDELLGEPVVRIGIVQGIRRGFLSRIDYRLLADDIDWNLLRSGSPPELNTRLLVPIQDTQAARTLAQVFAEERCRGLVVFCPSVEHARIFSATLRLVGFRAGAVTSAMPTAARERVMTQFRRGQLNAVATVDIFNEGVDLPDVDMLAFMRVTHSRRIFFQQLGRGLRATPEKQKVVVMDFVSDLRRLTDVIGLKRAVGDRLECLEAFEQLVQFRKKGAGQFIFEWLLDQADLCRKREATLLVDSNDDLTQAKALR
jgi:superfamily II DNA or RNA helicase